MFSVFKYDYAELLFLSGSITVIGRPRLMMLCESVHVQQEITQAWLGIPVSSHMSGAPSLLLSNNSI